VDPIGSLITTSASAAHFDLTTGSQIEVGVKQSLWDQRLEWTLAAYRIEKKDLLTQNPASANPEDILQVGQQSSRGIEASLALNVNDRWRIDANAVDSRPAAHRGADGALSLPLVGGERSPAHGTTSS
jgi:iron complex outermembrane recepter protein